jgi:glycosyltransferase involved in cell wall biosynthesis
VYLNSVAASVYARPALWLRRAVVLHAHESTSVARTFLESSSSEDILHRLQLVACSPSVHESLVELSGQLPSQVALVPSVPDSDRVRSLAASPVEHRYPAGDLVVGCCGSVEYRKGADLWLAAARRVRSALPDASIRFVWIGAIEDPELIADADREFVGPEANPYPEMARFDIATLPSRDDPFPLVVLESMLLGTPVVAFAVGGVAAQVGDAGILIEPGDVDAFADAIVQLLTDPPRRSALAERARTRAETVYSVDTFRTSIVEIVERLAQ